MDLLCLNAMRKFIANVKHHIYVRIYMDVNIDKSAYIYACICYMFARTRFGITFTWVSKYDLASFQIK